ncbi:MAG: hypothetical protein ABR571_05060 [Jatrophihabitans sp.]|uniref:hypothetical protein n=1 Tax=Jatrophihabitans sp. TaxID=1932789 RepID=UPI00391127F5
MSVLDALDATRICARSSAALADPDVWRRPVPVTPRRTLPAPAPDYSWRLLLRNPHALLVTGMVGTLMVKDAVLGIVDR